MAPKTNTITITADTIASYLRHVLKSYDPVDLFEPYHRVNIRYPARELLVGGGLEIAWFRHARNAEHRYNPTEPLIQDKAVKVHAGRNTAPELELSTFYQAAWNTPRPLARGNWNLLRDMEYCTKYTGTTQLDVVECIPAEGEEEPGYRVKIQRRTRLRIPPGGSRTIMEQENYLFNEEALELMFAQSKIVPWVDQLERAIKRLDDVSAKHMYCELENDPAHDWEYVLEKDRALWRPRREMKYADILDRIVRTVRIRDLETSTCLICAEDLGTPGHTPVALPCHPKHVYCRSCLVKICEADGPEAACCPEDRSRLFNAQQVEQLKFNVVGGIYWDDPRYTPTENFIRSCSDLDKEWAMNQTKDWISLENAPMIFDIWYTLFVSDFTAEEGSWPEHVAVMVGMEKRLQVFSGRRVKMSFAFKLLSESIFESLVEHVLKSKVIKYSTETEIRTIKANPKASTLWRPGFVERIDRSLNRLLRFLVLRECKQHPATMHFHGGRQFYNPDSFAKLFKQKGEKLKKPLELLLEEVRQQHVLEVKAAKSKTRLMANWDARNWREGRVEKRSPRLKK